MLIKFIVLWQLRAEQDAIKKEEKKAKLMMDTIPFYLAKFEKIVSENNGYSVGSGVSCVIISTSDMILCLRLLFFR